MKKVFGLALGVLTAIGGFVDIGDLVTNAVVGSRFGLTLVWVLPVGVLGICVFAEMSGRVAAVSGRGSFDLIRERLGPRVGLANLLASMGVTLLTFIAEIGGVALALELATSVDEVLWVPMVGLAVWLVLWRVRFALMENVLGLMGLALIAFAVAVWRLGPQWGDLSPVPVLYAGTTCAASTGPRPSRTRSPAGCERCGSDHCTTCVDAAADPHPHHSIRTPGTPAFERSPPGHSDGVDGQRVVVTGGAESVGSHLCERLLDDGGHSTW